MDRTYVWSYDNAGNILSKKTYALTAAGSTPTTLYSTNTYGYNDTEWGDLLTKFRSHTITCDEVGNPLSYYNRSSYSFSWKNGGQLATASKGSYTLSFTYDDNGIRTSKTVNGVEHVYTLNGSQIVSEAWGNELLIYIYDAEGSPIGMQYRSKGMAAADFDTYWFEKNLQGDIIAVYTEAGLKVCSYVYDAWGNFTFVPDYDDGVNSGDAQCAGYNPFHYRGYYYDSELGMYYLQSRYYDPNTGRFINADGQHSGGLLGYNQFAYCENNPVMRADPNGECWESIVAGIKSAAIWVYDNIIIPVAGVISNVVDDVSNFDISNTSEETVLEAHYFSAYKGTIAFKLPIGTNAFSFGFMFIGDKVGDKGLDPINIIKHEYGHSVQFREIGMLNYLKFVAIPSVLGCVFKVDYDVYFSLPWERIADKFGGVDNRVKRDRETPYEYSAQTLSDIYWGLVWNTSNMSNVYSGRRIWP